MKLTKTFSLAQPQVRTPGTIQLRKHLNHQEMDQEMVDYEIIEFKSRLILFI